MAALAMLTCPASSIIVTSGLESSLIIPYPTLLQVASKQSSLLAGSFHHLAPSLLIFLLQLSWEDTAVRDVKSWLVPGTEGS